MVTLATSILTRETLGPKYVCRYLETFQKTPNGFAYDNRWVVPHNPYLTKMFNVHINVEVSTGIRSVKYLFKYVYKGPDRVAAVIASPINEIQQYINAKYLSVAEGVNSLLSFKKHMEWPPVTRLVVHLPRQHNVIFNENENLAAMAERAAHQKTTFTAYFVYNAQNADGWNVVYANFPADHVWKIRGKVWSAQQRGEKPIGRMYFVHPVANERFFLCLLLTVVPGATSFEHLRIVDDIEHPTFQVACKALGLL